MGGAIDTGVEGGWASEALKQQQGEFQRREQTDARAGGGIWLSDKRFMIGLRWDQS